MKKNILIHGINWIWLWHIKRLITIAKSLKNDKSIWEIVFVSNSKNPFLIENEWFKFYELKYWIEDTLSKISFSDFEEENYLKMSEIIEKEKIDIVLHDTFFIKKIINSKKNLEHFLVLRDSEINYLETIKDFFPYFKKIFIPHIRQEFSSEKLKFFEKYKNIFFTSYILEKKKLSLTKTKKILISPGYWWDYEDTLAFFQYVCDFLNSIYDDIKEYEVEFVLWKYFEKLKKEIDFSDSFKLTQFYENLSLEIKNAWIFIWRWWYNTLNEVTYYNTKSLIFSVKRFSENQWNRIDFFSEKLWCNFIKKWIYDFESDKKVFLELLKNDFKPKDLGNFFNWIDSFKSEFLSSIKKENILVFKNIFLPKSENFIFEELNVLSLYNPIIFTLSQENEDSFKNNFQIIYKKYFEELLNLEYPKTINKDLYIEFLKYLAFLVKKYDVKVIYTEFLFDAYFIKNIKKFLDVKIVSAWRWFDVYEFLDKKYVDKKSLIESLDFLLVRDKNMKSKVLEYWFSSQKVEVVRSVVDFTKYEFIKKDFSKLDILIWWRFVEKKNLLELLDLVNLLSKSWIVWKIWIVWDWKLRSKMIWKINDLEMWEKVKFYWFLDHESLIKTLNLYNCFINYSKVSKNWDSEWIPNLIIENMLSWNLVFSSLNWWIEEVLIDWETWLALSLDIKEDWKKIVEFFNNWELEKILKNAFNLVREVFSEENWVGKLKKIFRKV